MFYTLGIRLRNNIILRRMRRKIRKLLDINPHEDIFDNGEVVKKYTAGKSFADIGCLWGIHGQNAFIAEEAGAIRSVGIDVYPATKEFLDEKKKRNSRVEFIEGDINLRATTNRIGVCDIVLCSGVLYHTPDPIHFLTRLRAICGEILILNTASIPEVPGIKNTAVFYPFLEEKQRKIWNRKIGSQKAITGPYEPEEGYANWFWGLTPSVIESMLACAGFDVIERYIFPFRTVFVCRAVEPKIVSESGEWTTPKGGDSLKFRR
jgi:ubiquinone/menaquinone biosynthesis C-methylase UbiE